MLHWKFYPVTLLAFLLVVSCGRQDGEPEAAIRQKAKSYEEAYNRGDAKALAALWAENAEYINPESGEVVTGRKAIESEFRDTFEQKKHAQIKITVDSIKFPSRNQAVEYGTAIVKQKEGDIDQTNYKATYEKSNGEWLLTQVREVEAENPPSNYEHLKGLEWLVGEWVDEDEDVEIKMRGKWDKYKNFLLQDFTVTKEGKLELEGRMIIGWDPINNRIRSWVFDSDGGYGEGIWKKKNDSWVVELSSTLADGRRASAINIYTPTDGDKYRWESTGREVGSELLPNLGPITVVRSKE